MYLYDWTFIILIPGILFALYAQLKVKSAFEDGNKIKASSGVISNDVANHMIYQSTGNKLPIIKSDGILSDHYNPVNKTLSLSSSTYANNTISAISVAAHEAGHALQDYEGYMPLQIRSAIVPVVNISSTLSPFIILLGFVFNFDFLINTGIIFYCITFLFTLITLPVEFNASKRAKIALANNMFISESEMVYVNKVLDAAALTYVAASINSLLQIIRLLLIRSRRND